MNAINGLIDKMTGWIDHLFGWGDVGVNNYSKLLVYGFLIFLGSKMIKIKWNLNTGK